MTFPDAQAKYAQRSTFLADDRGAAENIKRQSDRSDRVSTSAQKRRWFPRLSVRDLIWLCLLSAVLMTWYRDREALKDQLSKQFGTGGSSWSIDQVLGLPNTPVPGDQQTAWASATEDASSEWIIVEFPRGSNVKQIEIVETFNPGAVVRICSVGVTGNESEMWRGTDPTKVDMPMGKSMIQIKNRFRTRRVKIYLDSKNVPGWNEIDAVALHDRDGSIQWASNAWASSSFGDNRSPPDWYWP